MTVATDRPSLPEALGIPGARSVSLLDPDGPSILWWAGPDQPGEQQAAAVVSLAAAATALAGADDDLGDVILTSSETFHVIRLVGDGTGHVTHLTLARAGANLAMARRDFRLIVAGYAARPRHAAEPLPAPVVDAGPPAGADHPSGLPRRERSEPPRTTEEISDLPPDWFTSLIQAPFANDEGVLDRILVTLRSL
jgi:hypothetical protein